MNLLKSFCFLAATGLVWLEITVGHAAPFAPLIELPEDISSSDISFLQAQTVKNSVVPSKEEVGLPAYPGAKILFTQSGSTTTINGINTQTPNRVFLGSTASSDKVIEYYANALEGWSQVRENDSTIFVAESDMKNPLEDLTIEKIIITADDPPRNLMPEAQTNIDIYYNP